MSKVAATGLKRKLVDGYSVSFFTMNKLMLRLISAGYNDSSDIIESVWQLVYPEFDLAKNRRVSATPEARRVEVRREVPSPHLELAFLDVLLKTYLRATGVMQPPGGLEITW